MSERIRSTEGKECFMKKTISVFIMIILLFLLVSCVPGEDLSSIGSASDENNSSIGTESLNETEILNSSDASSVSNISNSILSYTFNVNASMPLYRCNINIKDDRSVKIDITDTTSNTLIQSIIPPHNEIFTKEAAYFVDITFSGNHAILIPLEHSASYIRFAAYVWDAENHMFTEIPSFSEILNPSINVDDKLIYSTRSASQITTYAVIEFKNNQFVTTRSFSWWPAKFDANDVSNSDQLMHCVETSGLDNTNIIYDFYVPNGNDIEKNDEQLKPYFEKGSFWDLNSIKWDCVFYYEINDRNILK